MPLDIPSENNPGSLHLSGNAHSHSEIAQNKLSRPRTKPVLPAKGRYPSDFKFDSIPNFRDIGGLWSVDLGRDLPYNFIYRSSAPVTGTERDIQILMGELHIQKVIDLRPSTYFVNETNCPYNSLFPKEKIFAMDMTGLHHRVKNTLLEYTGSIMSTFNKISDESTGAEAEFRDEKFLGQTYKDYLKLCQKKISTILDLFTVSQNYPILVCCSTGKDRTGIIIALILGVLGIGESTIVEEYHYSQLQLEQIKKYHVVRGEAPKEAILELICWIKKKYGSITQYLQTIGFTFEKQEMVKKIFNIK